MVIRMSYQMDEKSQAILALFALNADSPILRQEVTQRRHAPMGNLAFFFLL
jgi:hypothetical protein